MVKKVTSEIYGWSLIWKIKTLLFYLLQFWQIQAFVMSPLLANTWFYSPLFAKYHVLYHGFRYYYSNMIFFLFFPSSLFLNLYVKQITYGFIFAFKKVNILLRTIHCNKNVFFNYFLDHSVNFTLFIQTRLSLMIQNKIFGLLMTNGVFVHNV